jgi:hypothetical protein
MANKTNIRSKTNPGPDKPTADKDRHSHQPPLDRIDELQDFYDLSPVGYIILDRNGRILAAYLTSAMIMKVTMAEMIGQSFYSLPSIYPHFLKKYCQMG